MATTGAIDLRISGDPSGQAPGWPDRRLGAWLNGFLALGVALRLLRWALDYPFWRDEAYLAWNIRDRSYAGLMAPLAYQQVCPLLFLWAEKVIVQALGFGERSLRVLPTIASIAGLFLLRHVAGRLFHGVAPVVALAILAVGYTPIRHGGEVKPYATDFLAALGSIALAVEWLRARGRAWPLWGLAAIGPLAVGMSNPSIFVAASVGLVLAIPVLKSRSARSIVPFGLFGLATVAAFLFLLRRVNEAQSASVMPWMRVYWANAFPPGSVVPLLVWLARTHTSQMFAYPAGGDVGASSLTTALVLVAILAYWRRGPKVVLALLLMPFGLGLVASAIGRYPYGGSARTMQYVAPSIILLAGLGASSLLRWSDRATRPVLIGLFAVGLGMMAYDVRFPYKTVEDRDARDFARRFWAEVSQGAEVACAKTDLHLALDPLVWQGDRSALYLCHRAIFHPIPPNLERVGSARPLRVVVFGEVPADARLMADWIEDRSKWLRLRSRRERILNKGMLRGRASAEDRYVVYELIPAGAE